MPHLSTAIALSIVLAACSVSMPSKPEAAHNGVEALKKKTVEPVKSPVPALPDWFTEPPSSDTHIYDVATATSSDLQVALDKAILDAKYRVAERLRSQVSGQISKFIEESRQGERIEVYKASSKVVSSLFSDIYVGGFSVNRKIIEREGDRYRAYVLVGFPVRLAQQQFIQAVENNPIVRAGLVGSPGYKSLVAQDAGGM